MLRRVSTPVRATAFALLAGLFTLSSTTPSQAQGVNGPISWTGIYMGLHGSYMWADQEHPGTFPYVAPPAACSGAFGPGTSCGPPRHEPSGAMLGGQIGAQYHFQGGFVVGVEADYARGNLSETARDGNYIVQTTDIEWTGTLRGRLGLPMGNFMPFVTAGAIWLGASYTQSCPEPASVAVSGSHCGTRPNDPLGPFGQYQLTDSQTHFGFVYGGGAEWRMTRNFSLKAEALWYTVGEEVYKLGKTPTGRELGPKPIEYDGMMIRIGGNYHF
jgi:outer membrane immunogenic protein